MRLGDRQIGRRIGERAGRGDERLQFRIGKEALGVLIAVISS
jgi:hypothetical protein